MKQIIISFFILLSVARAQDYVYPDVNTFMVPIEFDTLSNDSTLIMELPKGAALLEMWIVADSAIAGSAGDSIKIGIQGERTTTPYRFADIAYDSLNTYRRIKLSHYKYRQDVAGMLYTYDGSVSITCTSAETYYPIQSFDTYPHYDFMRTSGGAIKIGPYQDGYYDARINMSFAANKANVAAHGEMRRNGIGFDYISFERTISTVGQVGNATASNGIYMAEGDTLEFVIKSDVNATVYTIHHGQFVLRRMQGAEPYTTDAVRQIWLYSACTDGDIRIFIRYRTLF